MSNELTPKELVKRSVAMARFERRIARRSHGSERVRHEDACVHCMKLARHIKAAALKLRSY